MSQNFEKAINEALAKTDKERLDPATRKREIRHGKVIRGLIHAFNKASWGSGTATEQQRLQAQRITAMARAKGLDLTFGQDPLGRSIGIGAGSKPIVVRPWVIGTPKEQPQFEISKYGKKGGVKVTHLDPIKGVHAVSTTEPLSMTALPQETRQAAQETADKLRRQRLKDVRFAKAMPKLEI